MIEMICNRHIQLLRPRFISQTLGFFPPSACAIPHKRKRLNAFPMAKQPFEERDCTFNGEIGRKVPRE
jgi:hypothetical protein